MMTKCTTNSLSFPIVKKSSIVVIKGRRRIGKSSLAKEFAKDRRFISFTGVAPVKGISSQDQLDEFARQSLVAYANGVNAWIKEGNILPIEFYILDNKLSSGSHPTLWFP